MKRIACLLLFFILLFACVSGAMEEKINATLEHMTFAERAAMLNGVVNKTAAGQYSRIGEQTCPYPANYRASPAWDIIPCVRKKWAVGPYLLPPSAAIFVSRCAI